MPVKTSMISPIITNQSRIAGENFCVRHGSLVAHVSGFDIVVKRPGHGTIGLPVDVMVNCFKVNLPTSVIYHYDGE